MNPVEDEHLEPHKTGWKPSFRTQLIVLLCMSVVVWLALWFVVAMMLGLWKLL